MRLKQGLEPYFFCKASLKQPIHSGVRQRCSTTLVTWHTTQRPAPCTVTPCNTSCVSWTGVHSARCVRSVYEMRLVTERESPDRLGCAHFHARLRILSLEPSRFSCCRFLGVGWLRVRKLLQRQSGFRSPLQFEYSQPGWSAGSQDALWHDLASQKWPKETLRLRPCYASYKVSALDLHKQRPTTR